MKGLHGTDKDAPGLRRHLMALYLADHRQEVSELFESLTDQIKALPQYAELGTAIYERSGLSRHILEQSLLGTGDLQLRLQIGLEVPLRTVAIAFFQPDVAIHRDLPNFAAAARMRDSCVRSCCQMGKQGDAGPPCSSTRCYAAWRSSRYSS